MKKLILVVACLASLILGTSGFVDSRREASIGGEAPALVLSSGSDTLSLEALKGRWVILSFWSASDAASRMERNRIESFMRGAGHEACRPIEVVSVNFDRTERLMQEIIRNDRLEGHTFHVGADSNAEAIRAAFCMKEELRTFVINPEGVLVAVDPTVEDLRKIENV